MQNNIKKDVLVPPSGRRAECLDGHQDDSISIDINENNDDSENNSNENNSNENNLILHKTDLILLNNGWNDKNEKLIISIGENAASYKWMHEKCSSYYKFQNSTINIMIIIFAVILTTETIFPESYSSSNLPLFISKQVLTYIITIMSIIQNFLKSEQKSERHLNASLQFNDLYHDIQKQMCMFRRDRTNATNYLADNLKRYDSLVINNPEINNKIINKFKNTFKNANIALPDIADKIQKIEIITEHEPKNTKKFRTRVKTNSTSDLTINLKDSMDNSCNHLSQIHNVFQIHGDISDKDLQNINPIELKELRNKFLQNKSNYEYQRFLQHSKETD